MEDIILVGFGGHAKSIADSIERGKKYKIFGYTELKKTDSKYKYLGTDEVLEDYYKKGIRNVFICQGYLGKGNLRNELYNYVKKIGYKIPIIIDPSSIISSSVTIDEGTFVGKGVIINAEAKIGKMCIINTKALIEHECKIGDFTHVAVGAIICGQVEIEKNAFVGANATIIQCRKINEGTIVPAGETIR